ncbi:MAG: PAS domain S-box protein [bacterium]|nr:PAS domain S-box protein [bacterium]
MLVTVAGAFIVLALAGSAIQAFRLIRPTRHRFCWSAVGVALLLMACHQVAHVRFAPVEPPAAAELFGVGFELLASLVLFIGLWAVRPLIQRMLDTEGTLRASEERLRAFGACLPDVAFIVDEDGRYVEVLTAEEGLLYREASELRGRLIRDVFPKHLADMFQSMVTRTIESNSLQVLEYDLEVPAGLRHFEARAFPMTGASSSEKLVVYIGRDITEHRRAQDALKSNIEFLETLIDTIPYPIFYTDLDGVHLGCNKTFAEEIVGLSRSQVIGHTLANLPGLLTQGDVDRFTEGDGELLDAPGTRYNETRLKCAGGEERDFLLCKATFMKGAGIVGGIVGVMIDMTKPKRAEEALRESEELHRITLGSISDAVFITDDKGAFTYICPNVDIIFGWTWSEVRALGFITNLLGHGLPSPDAVADRGEITNIEQEVVDKQQNRLSLLVTVKRVSIKGGTMLYTCRDITQRRLAQMALRDSESRFRALFHGANDAIFLSEFDKHSRFGRIIEVNDTACERLDRDREIVLGANLGDLDADPLDLALTDIAQDLMEKGAATYERELLTSGGTPIPFEFNSRVVSLQGGRVVLSIARDVSERRRAAEQERRQQQQLVLSDRIASMGALVAGVAHEISTPNHDIVTGASLLATTWADSLQILDEYHTSHGPFALAGVDYSEMKDRVPALLTRIQEAAESIRQTVYELRDYARERPEDEVRPVNLNQVVRSAATLLADMLKKTTRQFEAIYMEALPEVMGDYVRLEQVVVNLMHNACQALTDPDQAVRIATSYDEASRRVVVRVEDEGQGIAESMLPHVAQPFMTTRRDGGSVGLGLSVSMRIVKQHGGDMQFDSYPGEGTVVHVTLPVAEASGETGSGGGVDPE